MPPQGASRFLCSSLQPLPGRILSSSPGRGPRAGDHDRSGHTWMLQGGQQRSSSVSPGPELPWHGVYVHFSALQPPQLGWDRHVVGAQCILVEWMASLGSPLRAEALDGGASAPEILGGLLQLRDLLDQRVSCGSQSTFPWWIVGLTQPLMELTQYRGQPWPDGTLAPSTSAPPRTQLSMAPGACYRRQVHMPAAP